MPQAWVNLTVPVPTTPVWLLFAQWIGMVAVKDHAATTRFGTPLALPNARELETALKEAGFFPFIDGSNYPRMTHWYPGPIHPGMQFIWEATAGDYTMCRVTRVQTHSEEGNLIWVRCPKRTLEIWNDEERFRTHVLTYSRTVPAEVSDVNKVLVQSWG